jgi:hypothetical protein
MATIWERFTGRTLQGNVVLNFTPYPKGDLSVYALAYREAADILVAALNEQRGYSDADACPIVFLYRHSTELYLKAIILWGTGLVRLQSGENIDSDKLFDTHRFSDLLPAVERIFREAGWLDGEDKQRKFGNFGEINKLILTFEEIDPKSFAFRYPIDKKGSAHLPQHFCFNVIALAAEASEMLKTLDSAASGVYVMFQELASVIHEQT